MGTKPFFAVLLVWLGCVSVSHAQQIEAELQVYPLLQRGQLKGCQLGFSVLRSDGEYSNGQPSLVNGLLLVDSDLKSVGLRIGVASNLPTTNFTPPERAYLYANFQGNVADLHTQFESDEPGFRYFVFAFGPTTDRIMAGFLETGRIEVAYGPNNTTVDARIELDLNAANEAKRDWYDCIGTMLPKQAE